MSKLPVNLHALDEAYLVRRTLTARLMLQEAIDLLDLAIGCGCEDANDADMIRTAEQLSQRAVEIMNDVQDMARGDDT